MLRSQTVSPEDVVLKRPRTQAEEGDPEIIVDSRSGDTDPPGGDPDGDDDGAPEGADNLGNGQESGGHHGTSG